MPYGNFRINIYEHAHNPKSNQSEKKYFYAPIALLNHRSAVSFYNNVTQRPEVRFRIEMWNAKVETKVVNFLTDLPSIHHPIKAIQVQIIPLDKVILASTSPSYKKLNNLNLNNQIQSKQIPSQGNFLTLHLKPNYGGMD